jgi:DNA-binding transcriptional regulator YdaS (Cro superfamily)
LKESIAFLSLRPILMPDLSGRAFQMGKRQTLKYDAGVQRALDAAGGPSALAQILGIKSQNISQWGKCPPHHVLKIEEMTGVSRHVLRPDIYPVDDDQDNKKARISYPPDGGARPAAPQSEGHFSRFRHLRRANFRSGTEIDEHIDALRREWDRQ